MIPRRHEQRSIAFAKQLRRSMTRAEIILWSRLRGDQMQGLRFRRQHAIGPYVADFACTGVMLAIEVDGATHHMAEQRLHDAIRTAYFAKRGWFEVRVSNLDVYDNLDGVLEGIWRAANRKRF